MKKLLLIPLLCLVLAGCTLGEDKKVESPEVLAKYESEELGISFEYPTTLGKPQENKYKDTELLSVNFSNDKGTTSTIGLGVADYDTLRTCEDILSKGFYDGDLRASDCETLTINNKTVVLMTFGQSQFGAPSKRADFETKKGIWSFGVTDEKFYDDFLKIIKTLKSLED